MASRLIIAGLLAVTLSALGCARMAPITATAVEAPPNVRQGIIDRIVASSVKVTVERAGQQIVTGSGVVIASRADDRGANAVSYILTAAHVLEKNEGSQIFVCFTGSPATRGKFAATVRVRGDPEALDLAVLRVPGIAVTPATLPAADRVRVGEEIFVVGFPWGKRLGLFGGIVSQTPVGGMENGVSDEGTDQSLVIDASSSKGVSGGGVFDAATGSLVGIVEGYQTASIALKGQSQVPAFSLKVPMPGETFVVPIKQIRPFLEAAGIAKEVGASKLSKAVE